MRHQKVDFDWPKDRGIREALIKGFLKELRLTPPESIGNLEEGVPEIVAITDLFWNGNFFCDFVCLVQGKPGATPYQFVMRSNVGGDGDVFVPLIDGKIALTYEWRQCLGRKTWGIPRGFSSLWREEAGKKLGAKAIPEKFANALKELSEEVGQASDVQAKCLGSIPENSGSHTGSPAHWILSIGKLKIGGTEEGINVKLIPIQEVYEMIGGEIADNHSITALGLAQKHFR